MPWFPVPIGAVTADHREFTVMAPPQQTLSKTAADDAVTKRFRISSGQSLVEWVSMVNKVAAKATDGYERRQGNINRRGGYASPPKLCGADTMWQARGQGAAELTRQHSHNERIF